MKIYKILFLPIGEYLCIPGIYRDGRLPSKLEAMRFISENYWVTPIDDIIGLFCFKSNDYPPSSYEMIEVE